ncbi:type I restriction endonuclease subunit R [Teredinibacter turnerae]|uniref:type I restriction endonuclease subunit R n=1 Tax=Teredinibacter turnerae TaxID=2426 RepID=UPI0030D5A4D1
MPQEPRPERATQKRVIGLFSDKKLPNSLGYTYLGDRHQRRNNRNIEVAELTANLQKRGYSKGQISAAQQKLLAAADGTGVSLYQANMRTYQLLRYPVKVQLAADAPHEDVWLIDWQTPDNNDFAIAEEVTLKGGHQRRPDLVLYINGIAIAVIELKRGSVEVAEGIRQLITNQEAIFNQAFFTTVQLVLAGNDSQGLFYGTATTQENFFVQWKDETRQNDLSPAEAASAVTTGEFLDKPLAQLCNKQRLLDIIRNFVLFDAGIKKVPRPHQYFAVQAVKERVRQREGGVIWHTQGSGKSILMVLLAKWLMEHDPDARILIITDRDELDKQIEEVMRNAQVISEEAPSPRIASRASFIDKITSSGPRLLCALLHKFDPGKTAPNICGRFYIFVDECHRTQGGDMNRQMKAWFQEHIFIGFTGTPLLKKDKKTTRDVFGTYIHTYKYPQAVKDKVVLDIKYEARDVPQRLTSQKAVDDWFNTTTQNLNNYQKAVIRKHWATLEKLMSSKERKERIVASIIEDFRKKPRLNSDRGTAILVAASIYDACHYYRLIQGTILGRHCGIVTSFQPNHNAISREPAESDERYKYDTYTQFVLKEGQTTEKYEELIKERFKKEPANCKLLIVVSKLLTGFDAPSCTYIYLDQELRDHNLFQAICRTNRIDGEDKDYGHIVDFKKLFANVQEAIAVYSSEELDLDSATDAENNAYMKNWLDEGKDKFEIAREALKYLCEPVPAPKEMEQHLQYFCGNGQDPEQLLATEPLRISFYKAVVTYMRAYANISQDLEAAGYSKTEIKELHKETTFFTELRAAIKRHSGEELDIKPYEADMRHLMNTYIQADPADPLGEVDKYSLVELIVETGIHDAIAKKLNAKGKLSKKAISEGVINNISKTIIREQLTDPRFYEEMSELLGDLIDQLRQNAISYEEFLKQAEALAKRMAGHWQQGQYPEKLRNNDAAIMLFYNLPSLPADHFACPTDEDALANLALEIDFAMSEQCPAGWVGDETRERQVQNILFPLLDRDRITTEALFELFKNNGAYN